MRPVGVTGGCPSESLERPRDCSFEEEELSQEERKAQRCTCGCTREMTPIKVFEEECTGD